jgi:hypothetical protein
MMVDDIFFRILCIKTDLNSLFSFTDNFGFDSKENVFKYTESRTSSYSNNDFDNTFKYSSDEIIREDFGLYSENLILSYLEYSIKPANMLKTLEDLLVPMRFSRSISSFV